MLADDPLDDASTFLGALAATATKYKVIISRHVSGLPGNMTSCR